jgi:hypothetical protein
VTIDFRGITAAGAISARTSFASCFERWKNLGRTSTRFASVMAFARARMLVMQRRPSLRGSTTSGNFATRRAATLR